MSPSLRCLALLSALFALSASAQMKVRKVTEPAGKTLEKALKASTLGQPGAKPFHVKMQIAQTKGEPGGYDAVVEETWVSPALWVRTVTAKDLVQTVVVNDSGTHIVTTGDYYPMWLRNFVTALFTPVPDANQWNLSKTPLEHIELPNGARSNPCQHAEFNLGAAPAQQVNFANVCFRTDDALLDFVGSPSYAMEFHDYARFDHLRVARTLVSNPVHGVTVEGRVVTLENPTSTDPKQFATPPDSASRDPLSAVIVDTTQLEQLAGAPITLTWPDKLPGHGMFTSWVSLDTGGRLREAMPLNSDESGLAAEMTAQLVGSQWKGARKQGDPVQVEGAIVFTYPAAAVASR